jgi:hypothetical protein
MDKMSLAGVGCALIGLAVSAVNAELTNHWPFDCTDEDVVYGGFADIGDALYVVGEEGMGRQLDGVDDFIKCGIEPQMSVGESMTIAFWARLPEAPPDDGEPYNLLGLETTGAQEIRAYISESGTVKATWRDDGHTWDTRETDFSICDGLWHHIVMICDRDAGTTHLYVNGVHEEQGTAPAGPINVTDPRELYLGTSNHSGGVYGFWGGIVDDLRIYDHALSDAEILDLLPAWMSCPGDINRDGVVDQADLGALLAVYGSNCP